MTTKTKKNKKNCSKVNLTKIIKIKGPDWFHDPSGEQLEIIEIKEEKEQ